SFVAACPDGTPVPSGYNARCRPQKAGVAQPSRSIFSMESIYYVMAWACHRKCRHCYEDRFRPYIRGELEAVVAEAERNFPRIVDNLPERLTYLDLDDPQPDGTFPEKTGRIILSGGEALIDPVRERVAYKVIERLRDRYAGQGGI